MLPASSGVPRGTEQRARRTRRGGDQWHRVRTDCATYRAAVIVHRLGGARCAMVAHALGIAPIKAYAILTDCLRSPHVYHIARVGRGWFVPLSTPRRAASTARLPPARAGPAAFDTPPPQS